MAGNCPTRLRAISSQAYSFQRTVDVGAAPGDLTVDCAVDSGRVGDCVHAATTAARTQQRTIRMVVSRTRLPCQSDRAGWGARKIRPRRAIAWSARAPATAGPDSQIG